MADDNQPKLKAGMKVWGSAVAAHNAGRYQDALDLYGEVPNISGRMYYNMACAHDKLGDVDNALKCLANAVEHDKYLAIAFFQRGSLFLQQKRTQEAIPDLEEARMLLRGNNHINYKPLGLLGCMYSYQVLHNLALARIYEGNTSIARQLLLEALYDSDDTQKHLINKSLESLKNGTVDNIKPFLVPTNRVFSPSKSITKNLVKKSLIQKARVVSAANVDDLSPTFNGSRRLKEIKQNPEKNQTQSPFATMGRFVKAKKPHDRLSSEVFGLTLPQPVRGTRSMGDIRNFVNGYEEIEIEPKGPFKGLKKLLKPKSRTSAPVCDELDYVLDMEDLDREFGSTGDLDDTEDDPVFGTIAMVRSLSNSAVDGVRPETETQRSMSMEERHSIKYAKLRNGENLQSSDEENINMEFNHNKQGKRSSVIRIVDDIDSRTSFVSILDFKKKEVASEETEIKHKIDTIPSVIVTPTDDVTPSVIIPSSDSTSMVDATSTNEIIPPTYDATIAATDDVPITQSNDVAFTQTDEVTITQTNEITFTQTDDVTISQTDNVTPVSITSSNDTYSFVRIKNPPAKQTVSENKDSSDVSKRRSRPPPPAYPPPSLPERRSVVNNV